MNLEQVLAAFNAIANRLSDPNQLDSIKLTQSQLAFQFSPNLNMIAYNDVRKIDEVLHPDFINNFNNQFIFSIDNPDERKIYNMKDDEDICVLRKCIHAVSDFVCSCTGSETVVSKDFVMVYIDSNYFTAADFIGVNTVFDTPGKLMFDDQRNFLYYSMEEIDE